MWGSRSVTKKEIQKDWKIALKGEVHQKIKIQSFSPPLHSDGKSGEV